MASLNESLEALPIFSRKQDILAAVDANQVTIITAETGAGKSTQVPQYLAEHGYKKIIVTQPRILAARNLCYRVREEYSWRQGTDATQLVGYRTAHEEDDDPNNTILYCTDGLQLVRELTGSGVNDKQVLILDEIHEWNENMEVLIAWAKKRCQEEPHFKVVIMSATIEAEDLAAYFGTQAVISVEGRSFPVEKRRGADLIAEILHETETSVCNMLVFLPGKAEIEDVAEVLKTKVPTTIPIIPLHSQLEPDAQQRAFESYSSGKIVLTTNVAQTSITIDDIDVVIDSGLERRSEVRSGVEGLFLAEVSQADCLQRAGRAGRTKHGTYILAQLNNYPCAPLQNREPYGVPEIMRKHIDRLVLRLANISIDIESLEFYHSPSRKAIKLAKRTLVSLGALTGEGTVTDIGRRMERFPVESSYARMLIEAEACSQEVQSKLATIIAIQEVGGIVKGGARYSGWKTFTKQTKSDLVAQYDVYLAMPREDAELLEELGIIAKNVAKAEEVNERLHRDLNIPTMEVAPVSDDELEPVLKCIVAGQLHQLWAVETNDQAVHLQTGKRRELSNSSVVRGASLVTGVPFDLEVPSGAGLETLHLVNDITAVDPAWLEELAPDLFTVKPGKVYFDPQYGTLATKTTVTYKGTQYEAASVPVFDRSQQTQQLFLDLYSEWLHQRIQKERETLKLINSRSIPNVTLRQVKERVRPIAQGAVSLMDFGKREKIELSRLGKLETYVGSHVMTTLAVPDARSRWQPRQRRGWQPPHKRRFK